MNTITIDDLKTKDFSLIDSMLKSEVVHVKKDETFKYVIMTEDEYRLLLDKHFEDETLYSYSQYKDNKFNTGSSKDLFVDLGI